jgi:WD40 repeat protein
MCLKTLSGHSSGITSALFSEDGKFIVTASKDKTIRIWDASSGECLHTLIGHSSEVTSALYSPDGKFIISTSNDKTARLWDATSGDSIYTLVGHRDAINSVNYSEDGKFIITTGANNEIKIWRAQTNLLVATLYQIDYKDWAVLTPQGYFDASDGAMRQMYYVAGLQTIELDQLKEKFYAPGLLHKLLGYDKEKVSFNTSLDSLSLFPEISDFKVNGSKNNLSFKLRNQGGGFGPVYVWIDGKEITEDARFYDKSQIKVNNKIVRNISRNYFDTLMNDEIQIEVDLPVKYLTPGDTNILSVAA